jgi:hypothetical protein
MASKNKAHLIKHHVQQRVIDDS